MGAYGKGEERRGGAEGTGATAAEGMGAYGKGEERRGGAEGTGATAAEGMGAYGKGEERRGGAEGTGALGQAVSASQDLSGPKTGKAAAGRAAILRTNRAKARCA